MAAEGLQPAAEPGWELEAWYQDLQEVLAAAEAGGPSPPWGAEQAELAPPWCREQADRGPEGCELDVALAAELLELLGPESATGTQPAGPAGSAPSRSSAPGLGAEEDEARVAAGCRVKRKRCGGMAAGRELAKRREQANEQRVLELTAHNEQLQEEIRRLSAEVARTRAALIDRIVNLRRA